MSTSQASRGAKSSPKTTAAASPQPKPNVRADPPPETSTSMDSPTRRPRRERKIKYPFGDDFVTSVTPTKRKNNSEDDYYEDEVSESQSPLIKKPKSKSQVKMKKLAVLEQPRREVVVTGNGGEKRVLIKAGPALIKKTEKGEKMLITADLSKEKTKITKGVVEESEGGNISAGKTIVIEENFETETETDKAKGDGFDDNDECEETFGKPCYISESKIAELPAAEILHLLSKCRNKICVSRLENPKAGEGYLYDTNIVKALWEDDGFEWERVEKDTKINISSVDLFKSVDVSVNSQREIVITRYVYALQSDPSIILVYYKAENEEEENKEDGEEQKEDHDILRESMKELTEESQQNQGDVELGDDDPEFEEDSHFDYEDALDMLADCSDKISQDAPTYPKAGEVYFFDTDKVGEMWKFDQYLWRNCGNKSIPSKSPRISKSFFKIRLSAKDKNGSHQFKRIVYKSISHPNIIMVHYMGDSSVFRPRPHGSSKTKSDIYTPSPLRQHSLSRPAAPVLSGLEFGEKIKHFQISVRKSGTLNVTDESMNESMNESGNESQDCVRVKSEKTPKDKPSNKSDKKPPKKKRLNKTKEIPVKPLVVTDPHSAFTFESAIEILKQHSESASMKQAMFPKGGEAYVHDSMNGGKWKNDGYSWAMQRSTSYFPRQKPEVVRKLHCVDLQDPEMSLEDVKRGSKLFQRYTYCLVDKQNILLIHYVGDHVIAGGPVKWDEENMELENQDQMKLEEGEEEQDESEEEEEATELEERSEFIDENSQFEEQANQEKQPDPLIQPTLMFADSTPGPGTEDATYTPLHATTTMQSHAQAQTMTISLEEEFSEEFVKMKLEELAQQKRQLQMQESKLSLEIQQLNEEKQQFYQQYGFV